MGKKDHQRTKGNTKVCSGGYNRSNKREISSIDLQGKIILSIFIMYFVFYNQQHSYTNTISTPVSGVSPGTIAIIFLDSYVSQQLSNFSRTGPNGINSILYATMFFWSVFGSF